MLEDIECYSKNIGLALVAFIVLIMLYSYVAKDQSTMNKLWGDPMSIRGKDDKFSIGGGLLLLGIGLISTHYASGGLRKAGWCGRSSSSSGFESVSLGAAEPVIA